MALTPTNEICSIRHIISTCCAVAPFLPCCLFLGRLVVRRGRVRNWLRAGERVVRRDPGLRVVACPGRLVGPLGSGGSLTGPPGSESS